MVGGIGNQLFQYAVARRIAYYHNEEIKFDISDLENNQSRKFSLGRFNIIGSIASSEEIEYYKKYNKNKLFNTILLKKRKYIEEPSFAYWKKIQKVKGDVYLAGYWQSEKYFHDVKNILLKEIILKPEYSCNGEIIDSIKNIDSVSIHVRRGDYINNKNTHEFHGICDPGYFYKAVNEIGNVVSRPCLFIFSDDIPWCRKNILFNYPTTYVENEDFRDLQLMSLCRHNIISNSTFGWWGAWLNKNPKKIVLAPKKWFKNPKMNGRDLIPESWRKI
jgi:hypothetical protein